MENLKKKMVQNFSKLKFLILRRRVALKLLAVLSLLYICYDKIVSIDVKASGKSCILYSTFFGTHIYGKGDKGRPSKILTL